MTSKYLNGKETDKLLHLATSSYWYGWYYNYCCLNFSRAVTEGVAVRDAQVGPSTCGPSNWSRSRLFNGIYNLEVYACTPFICRYFLNLYIHNTSILSLCWTHGPSAYTNSSSPSLFIVARCRPTSIIKRLVLAMFEVVNVVPILCVGNQALLIFPLQKEWHISLLL